INVSFTPPPAPLPPLTVDRDAIAQVLINLLDNALKYSNGDKTIDVWVEGKADAVRIAVRDHGIGIPTSEQKKIFEKFYRVGSGGSHNVRGGGVGVARGAQGVRAQGGGGEGRGAPGRGSVFPVVLPAGGAGERA